MVAGRPLHCAPVGGHRSQQSFSNDWATSTNLIQPQSIAFAPNGDLYVAESDSQRINRVRMVATNGKVNINLYWNKVLSKTETLVLTLMSKII